MKKQKEIKGTSCKNPPYEYMTAKKWASLGETMTLQQALNLWWNSVRVRTGIVRERTGNDIITCYKCYDGTYDIYELEDILSLEQEDVLKKHITLDDEYEEDSDGYPIVFATLVD